MRMHRFEASLGSGHSVVVAVLVLLLALAGCAGEESGSSSGWTVDEGGLTLEEDLMVSERDAFYFGSVSDVAVASDGRMFVLDAQASHVKMLRPDGTLIDSIGGSGQGPGEFERVGPIAVARGDSLYVLERGSREISVFTPAGQFVRAVPFTTGGATPEAFMVPRDTPRFLLALTSFPPPGSDEEGVHVVQRIGPGGTPGDTLVRDRPRQTVSLQKGNFFVFHFVPFDVQPDAALGPGDRVHFSRTDSLQMDVYSLAGEPERSVGVPFDPVPITQEERTAELEDLGSDVRSQIADAMPESKPAFRDVFLDDEGRYWFRRPTAHADSTDWWVADPEDQRVATMRLPDHVYIMTARDGYAYGSTYSKAGAPALVRYGVEIGS